jgi:hypothetical protein
MAESDRGGVRRSFGAWLKVATGLRVKPESDLNAVE